MLRLWIVGTAAVLLGISCGGDAATQPTISLPATTATSVTATQAPEPTAAVVGLPCEAPMFGPARLPDRATGDFLAPELVGVDRWTAIPGTSLAIWSDSSGAPVVVLVRGALPPERWSEKPDRISVRGVDAALAPLSEGMWAAAWFEGPDRCDEYTLYVYPPTDRDEVRSVAESVTG